MFQYYLVFILLVLELLLLALYLLPFQIGRNIASIIMVQVRIPARVALAAIIFFTVGIHLFKSKTIPSSGRSNVRNETTGSQCGHLQRQHNFFRKRTILKGTEV